MELSLEEEQQIEKQVRTKYQDVGITTPIFTKGNQHEYAIAWQRSPSVGKLVRKGTFALAFAHRRHSGQGVRESTPHISSNYDDQRCFTK